MSTSPARVNKMVSIPFKDKRYITAVNNNSNYPN